MKPNPGMLVWVRYFDHCCYHGWQDVDRVRKPSVIETVGWVHKIETDAWHLNPSKAIGDDGKIDHVDNVSLVLTPEIIEWCEIK